MTTAADGSFVPKPSHLRLLRAFAEVLDSGAPVTWAAVARAAGISREWLWRLRRQYPALQGWLMAFAKREADDMLDAVVAKLGTMALRGSVDHAKLYLQVCGRIGGDGAGANVNVHASGPAIINVAVPRPGQQPVSSSAERMKG
jgi:hypothetical protein